MGRAVFFGLAALAGVAGCATDRSTPPIASEHRIVGPRDYTVDWDLPETDNYWIPKETEADIKIVSEACKAAIDVFVYHHTPRPPQFSYTGFSFEGAADEEAKACLLSKLKAVRALTAYPKKR